MSIAEYQAKKVLLDRVRRNILGAKPIFKEEDAQAIYNSMAAMFPDGSRVMATYFRKMDDVNPRIAVGIVEYSVDLRKDEPLFEIRFSEEDRTMLAGSLLHPLP